MCAPVPEADLDLTVEQEQAPDSLHAPWKAD
jgi:hypothetical protein